MKYLKMFGNSKLTWSLIFQFNIGNILHLVWLVVGLNKVIHKVVCSSMRKKTKTLLITPYTMTERAGLVPSFNIKATFLVTLCTIIQKQAIQLEEVFLNVLAY